MTDENREVRRARRSFPARYKLDILEEIDHVSDQGNPALGIIDFERGVKMSGSRFYVLRGAGARLQRAIIQFMLDYHGNVHGYTEIYPPFMVRSAMFVGAGQLPKFADNIYRDAEEDFMWLGTAEIALTSLHRDELLDEAPQEPWRQEPRGRGC